MMTGMMIVRVVDRGVVIPDIVEAVVMAGRNLPLGPLLKFVLCFTRMTQGPLSCNESARRLRCCTRDRSEGHRQDTRKAQVFAVRHSGLDHALITRWRGAECCNGRLNCRNAIKDVVSVFNVCTNASLLYCPCQI